MNERPTNQLPDDDDLIRLQKEFFAKKVSPAANIIKNRKYICCVHANLGSSMIHPEKSAQWNLNYDHRKSFRQYANQFVGQTDACHYRRHC